jgi:PDZ domain-containing protein
MKMNHKQIAACMCILVFSSMLYAGQGERGYIGVMLDPGPLSPLLAKHLGLSPDQGLRVKNVNRGTPADKVGLERDDIIIGLNGQKVTDHKGFIDNIIQVGAGNTIELEIIHEGQRKAIVFSLAGRSSGFDPKFPPEPEVVQEWRPGKVFHFDADKKGWIEIEAMGVDGQAGTVMQDVNIRIPATKPGTKTDIKGFLKEHYVFHYSDGDSSCVITIDGAPHDSDTTVTVEKGDKKYSSSVDAIDALPADVQDHAKRALKQARQSARKRTRTKVWNQHSQAFEDFMEEHPPEEWKGYTDKVLDRVKVFIDREELPQKLLSKDKLGKIEEHLQELSARMERLEKELLNKLRSIHGNDEHPDESHEATHEEGQHEHKETEESADKAEPMI